MNHPAAHPAPQPAMTRYTCVACGRHWRTNTQPTRCPYCYYDRSAPRPDRPPYLSDGRRGR